VVVIGSEGWPGFVVAGEAQRVGSWPAAHQQAIVEDAAIVYFTKSQFVDEIGDPNPLTLLLSKRQTIKRLLKSNPRSESGSSFNVSARTCMTLLYGKGRPA
jgi:hypothetical protein